MEGGGVASPSAHHRLRRWNLVPLRGWNHPAGAALRGIGETTPPPTRAATDSPSAAAASAGRAGGGDQALGAVLTEGRAGLVELEGTEVVLAEVAVVAGRSFGLARHGGHVVTAVTLP